MITGTRLHKCIKRLPEGIFGFKNQGHRQGMGMGLPKLNGVFLGTQQGAFWMLGMPSRKIVVVGQCCLVLNLHAKFLELLDEGMGFGNARHNFDRILFHL
jgi:hypothetical protein